MCFLQFWSGLPADVRKVGEDSLREANHYQMDLEADLDKKLLEDLTVKGMQVTFPDREAFRKATAPAYDAFCAKFGDRCQKVIEAIRGM